ncbi:Fc.00g073060.m01.CDS01 [Cosmosporella sp. VM-42]
MEKEPEVHSFFDPVTGTWQYVVNDPATSEAVIIDPVLDYDPTTRIIQTKNADSLLSFIDTKRYHVSRILETHAHADHITAASYLQSRLAEMQGEKPLVCIGKRISQVQELFSKRYGIPAAECEGVFDRLLEDKESFSIGTLTCTAIHLPGHTPDHMGYFIGDNVFCGDSIFHSDIGTARCDFPGGSAKQLYQSGQKLLALPDYTKIWTGHDYPSKDRKEAVPFLTVRDHRERNKHLADGTSEEQYVTMRTLRDEQMGEPKLLHQSLQMNIRGGRLPALSAGDARLLHLPLQLGAVEW